MDSTHPRRGRPGGQTGADLLAVAREVFLAQGYAKASMDEVAARARISKSSLYREHASKAGLYAAVVSDWAAAGRDAMKPSLERLVASENVRDGLIEWAETLRRGVLSPAVLSMRRLVTSEAAAQPDVAAEYLQASWQANIDKLADALDHLSQQNRLRIAEPHAAAEQLTWLVIGEPLNARLLTANVAHAARPVENAIDLFLAGYGPGRGLPSSHVEDICPKSDGRGSGAASSDRG